MELKDFISETLYQIVGGVTEAQSKVGDLGGDVCPYMLNTDHKMAGLLGYTKNKKPVMLIEFDVNVQVEKGDGTKGGIGIVVGGIALGSQGESNQKEHTFSRIQFQVPLALPTQKRNNKKEDKV